MTEQVKRHTTTVAKGCIFSQKRRPNTAKQISGTKYSNSVPTTNDCMTLHNPYQGIYNDQACGDYRYLARYAPPTECGDGTHAQSAENGCVHYPQNPQDDSGDAPYYWMGSSHLVENGAPPGHIPAASVLGTDIQMPTFAQQARLRLPQREEQLLPHPSSMWTPQLQDRLECGNQWLDAEAHYAEGDADLYRSDAPPGDMLDSAQTFETTLQAHCDCDNYQYSGQCYCYDPQINYRMGISGTSKNGNSLSGEEIVDADVSFEHPSIIDKRIITMKSKVERSVAVNRILFTSNEDYAQEQLMQKEFQWLNNMLLQDDDINEPIIRPPDLDQVSVETVISSENQYDNSIGSCKSFTESKNSIPVQKLLQKREVASASPPPASLELTQPKLPKGKLQHLPATGNFNERASPGVALFGPISNTANDTNRSFRETTAETSHSHGKSVPAKDHKQANRFSKSSPFQIHYHNSSSVLKSPLRNTTSVEEAPGKLTHDRSEPEDAREIDTYCNMTFPGPLTSRTRCLSKSYQTNSPPISVPLYHSLQLPVPFTGSSDQISTMSNVTKASNIISLTDIRTSSSSFVGLCQGHSLWTPTPDMDAQFFLPHGILLLRVEYQPRMNPPKIFTNNHQFQKTLDHEEVEASACVKLTAPLVHALRFDPDGSVRLNLTFDILYDKKQGSI